MSDLESDDSFSVKSSRPGRDWAVVNATGDVESSSEDGSDSAIIDNEHSTVQHDETVLSLDQEGQVDIAHGPDDNLVIFQGQDETVIISNGQDGQLSIATSSFDDESASGRNSERPRTTSLYDDSKPVSDEEVSYVQSGEASIQSGEMAVQSREVSVQCGGMMVQSGEIAVQSGEIAVQSGEIAVQSGEVAVQSGEVAVRKISTSLTSIPDEMSQSSARSSSSDSSVEVLSWSNEVLNRDNDDMPIFGDSDMKGNAEMTLLLDSAATQSALMHDLTGNGFPAVNFEANFNSSTSAALSAGGDGQDRLEINDLTRGLSGSVNSEDLLMSRETLRVGAGSDDFEFNDEDDDIFLLLDESVGESGDGVGNIFPGESPTVAFPGSSSGESYTAVIPSPVDRGHNKAWSEAEPREEPTFLTSTKQRMTVKQLVASLNKPCTEWESSNNFPNPSLYRGHPDIMPESYLSTDDEFEKIDLQADNILNAAESDSRPQQFEEVRDPIGRVINENGNNSASGDGDTDDAVEDGSLTSDVDDRSEIAGVAPVDTDDISVATNISYEPQELRAGQHVYCHRPNRHMNALLTVLCLVAVLHVCGIGIGHFLGSTRKHPTIGQESVSGVDGAADASDVEQSIRELILTKSQQDLITEGRLVSTVSNLWKMRYEELTKEKNFLEDRLAALQSISHRQSDEDHDGTKDLEQERVAFDNLSERLIRLNAELTSVAANLSQSRHNMNATQSKLHRLVTKISLLKAEKSALTAAKDRLQDDLISCLSKSDRNEAEKQWGSVKHEAIESDRERNEAEKQWGSVKHEAIESDRERQLKNQINELRLENTELQEMLANQRYGKHPGNSGASSGLSDKHPGNSGASSGLSDGKEKATDPVQGGKMGLDNSQDTHGGKKSLETENKNSEHNTNDAAKSNDDDYWGSFFHDVYDDDNDSEDAGGAGDVYEDMKKAGRMILMLEGGDVVGGESIWVDKIFPVGSDSVGVTGDHVGFISRALSDAAAVDLSISLLSRLDLNLSQWCNALQKRLSVPGGSAEDSSNDGRALNRNLVREFKEVCSKYSSFPSTLESMLNEMLIKLSDVTKETVAHGDNIVKYGQKGRRKVIKELRMKFKSTITKLQGIYKTKVDEIRKIYAPRMPTWLSVVNSRDVVGSDMQAQKSQQFETQRKMFHPEKLLDKKYFKLASKDGNIEKVKDALEDYIYELKNLDRNEKFKNTVEKHRFGLMADLDRLAYLSLDIQRLAISLQKSTPRSVLEWVWWQQHWWKRMSTVRRFELEEILVGQKFWSNWQVKVACRDVLMRIETSEHLKPSLEMLFNSVEPGKNSGSKVGGRNKARANWLYRNDYELITESQSSMTDTPPGNLISGDDRKNQIGDITTSATQGSRFQQDDDDDDDDDGDDDDDYDDDDYNGNEGKFESHDSSWYLLSFKKDEWNRSVPWYSKVIQTLVGWPDIEDDKEIYEQHLYDRYHCSPKYGCYKMLHCYMGYNRALFEDLDRFCVND